LQHFTGFSFQNDFLGATKMIDGGGLCEYQQRPLATDLSISNMQFPTDPPRSTICYGDGDVQGTSTARLIDPLLESDTFYNRL